MTRAFFQPFKVSSAQRAALYVRKKNRAAVPVIDVTALPTGSIPFSANPSSSNTITIGGTVITFGTTVAIGASLAITLASLLAFLQASLNVNLVKNTYAISGNSLVVTGKTVGTGAVLSSNFTTVVLSTQPTIRKRITL